MMEKERTCPLKSQRLCCRWAAAFAEENGLENPFDPERVPGLRKALDPMLP